MADRWPNFFIVGAAKAATTSLYSYLGQHPDIYMSPTKETHFFSLTWSKAEKRGGDALEEATRDYLELFEDADAPVRGEASPSYLWVPQAAERIHGKVPDARILVSLRDPVKRAWSHYLMAYREGREDRGFVDALQARLDGDFAWTQSRRRYVEPGRYCGQVERYLETFGDDQVMVVLLDELKEDAVGLLKRICRFLDVDPDPVDTFDLQQRYGYREPRGEWARRLRNHETVQQVARAVLPYRLRVWLGDDVLLKDTSKPEMPEKARRMLEEVYAPEIDCLEDLLGRDLPELRASWEG